MKDLDTAELMKIAGSSLMLVEHNIDMFQLLKLAGGLPQYLKYEIEESRVPYDGLFVSQNEMLIPDFEETIQRLRATIYEGEAKDQEEESETQEEESEDQEEESETQEEESEDQEEESEDQEEESETGEKPEPLDAINSAMGGLSSSAQTVLGSFSNFCEKLLAF